MINLIARAVWFIEGHYASHIDLADIAHACQASRYHLSRSFTQCVGVPIMSYLRGRRLSVAARSLVEGTRNVSFSARAAGYSSAEAFTRAFREHFGVTPTEIRSKASSRIVVTSAKRVDAQPTVSLSKPRMVYERALHIAGIAKAYSLGRSHEVPAQWQELTRLLGKFPVGEREAAFGIRSNEPSGAFTYLSGVEIRSSLAHPQLQSLRLPVRSYVVFTHRDHVSTIRASRNEILKFHLPRLNLMPLDAPEIERYGSNFDAHTGFGGVEIWIPVSCDQACCSDGSKKELM